MSQSPVSSQVYYKDVYWNDHSSTLQYFYNLISAGWNNEGLWWPAHFKKKYLSQQIPGKALIINCGNGWAERELYKLGMFETADAFDYSEDLLKQAREAAKDIPINYFWADCNKVEVAQNSYDLVINVAAMHHVQYIDRLNRLLANCLKPEGFFVNFDYVGPHRNQYSKHHFELLTRINSKLPVSFRKDPLIAPHLPTMLHTDPTEAIHSELVLQTFERYFYTLERKDLNGAIAYQLMHNNLALVQGQTDEAKKCVELLLDLDLLYSTISELPTLFSFFVGKARKAILGNEVLLQKFSLEEQKREERAVENSGLYYVD